MRPLNKFQKNRVAGQQGSALVELAIVLPILMLMAVGVTNFGMALGEKQVIVEAARYGARRASAEGSEICFNENTTAYKRCDQVLVDTDTTGDFTGVASVSDGSEHSSFLATYYACQSIQGAGLNIKEWKVRPRLEADELTPSVSIEIKRAVPGNIFVSSLMGSSFPAATGTFINRQLCNSSAV